MHTSCKTAQAWLGNSECAIRTVSSRASETDLILEGKEMETDGKHYYLQNKA